MTLLRLQDHLRLRCLQNAPMSLFLWRGSNAEVVLKERTLENLLLKALLVTSLAFSFFT